MRFWPDHEFEDEEGEGWLVGYPSSDKRAFDLFGALSTVHDCRGGHNCIHLLSRLPPFSIPSAASRADPAVPLRPLLRPRDRLYRGFAKGTLCLFGSRGLVSARRLGHCCRCSWRRMGVMLRWPVKCIAQARSLACKLRGERLAVSPSLNVGNKNMLIR